MSLDFNEFPVADKEIWKNKIISDLKGKKNYSDLDYVMDKNIVLEACQTEVSYTDNNPLLFNPCGAGADIRMKDSTAANEAAHWLLQSGIQAVRFEMSANSEVAVLLKDIDPAYVWIDLDMASCPESMVSEVQNHIMNHYPDHANQFINHHQTKDMLPDSNIFIVIADIDLKDQVSDQLMHMFKNVKQNLYRNYHSHPAIRIATGPLIPDTIAMLRAIRMIWNTLLSDEKHLNVQKTMPRILLHPDMKMLHEDRDLRLIQMTYMMFSAYAGGADIMYGLPVHKTEDLEYARLSLNIPHIFNEESKLNKVTDPFAGSYFIENATRQWVDLVMSAVG